MKKIILFLSLFVLFMFTGYVSWVPPANSAVGWVYTGSKFRALDSNGDPLSGGKLYTYDCGTTTNRTTYPTEADATAETNANSNPVVLDSRGEASVFAVGCTKFVLKTSADVTVWTTDNITGLNKLSTDAVFLAEHTAEGAHTITEGNYYYPSAAATDQGLTGDNNTIKYYVDTIGTTEKGTIYLRHDSGNDTTTYTLSTSETIPSNISVEIENGAYIVGSGGAKLTVNGPFNAGPYKITTADSFIFGTGSVTQVYPHWWGASISETAANNKTAIDIAVSTGLFVEFIQGTYDINGLASAAVIKLKSEFGATLDNTHATDDTITLAVDSYPELKNINLAASNSTTGTAIKGINSTCRNMVLEDVDITGHKSGIDIYDGLNGSFNRVYVAGQGSGVAGGVGVKFGTSGAQKGTTWQTNSMYVTSFETNIVNHSSNSVFARTISESSIYGVKNYSGSTYIGAFFSSITTYDFDLYSNGCVIIGYKESATNKINFSDTITKTRTTVLHDTFDTAGYQFGRLQNVADTPPSSGAFLAGDMYWNRTWEAGEAIAWVCTTAGSPGTWQSAIVPTVISYGASVSTSGTGEDTLRTFTIPGGTIGAEGGFEITAMLENAGAAGNKTIKFKFGGSTVTIHPADNNTLNFLLKVYLQNSTESVNRLHYILTDDAGAIHSSGYSALAEDTSVDKAITITGECADAGDTVTLLNMVIRRAAP